MSEPRIARWVSPTASLDSLFRHSDMRRSALIIVLCFPMLLRAQQQSNPGSTRSNGVARTFLSFGQPYGGWLLLAFDSIPASRYGYRPTPVQQSVGYIAQHLESANYGLCSLFGKQKHVMTARDSL